MKKNILITAPHSFCNFNEIGRNCDKSALNAALSLESIFQSEYEKDKSNNFFPILLLPNILRRDCDLNRKVCRNKDYRKIIRQIVAQNNIGFLLDVHSFPSGSFDGDENTKIVLLDNPKENLDNYEDYSILLENYLNEKKIQTKLLFGKNNDIQIEAKTDFNIPSILIEFREENSMFENKLAALHVVKFLNQFFFI